MTTVMKEPHTESPELKQLAEPIIDTDVHEMIGNPFEVLPYVDEPWRSRIHIDNWMGYSIPYSWPTTGGLAKADARPPSGFRAGSDPDFLREQLLDAWPIERAILTGLLYPTEMKVQPEFAAALAKGYNDWIINHWLPRDERFCGSVHVAAQLPEVAAREIDRVGQHPQMVQVMLPVISHDILGREYYHPIYEAAERNGLVVGFHQGASIETACGLPPYYIEWHTGIAQAWQQQLVGLVVHGVLDKFPDLRVIMIESSWTWLPHLMWRFDHNFRSLRREVPWVKRMPSEYLRERVRFTTQPMEFVENAEHLYQMFEMVGNDEFLLFSTDYPHWDFDSPERSLPSSFPQELKRKILYDNAVKFYGF
jgi:predicted TIM-barrel fold metal-dependent hydrolase